MEFKYKNKKLTFKFKNKEIAPINERIVKTLPKKKVVFKKPAKKPKLRGFY
jgi:hypothetical protein